VRHGLGGICSKLDYCNNIKSFKDYFQAYVTFLLSWGHCCRMDRMFCAFNALPQSVMFLVKQNTVFTAEMAN
jgi:hypothetical protein